MSYKTLLVHLDTSHRVQARLEIALRLARVCTPARESASSTRARVSGPAKREDSGCAA